MNRIGISLLGLVVLFTGCSSSDRAGTGGPDPSAPPSPGAIEVRLSPTERAEAMLAEAERVRSPREKIRMIDKALRIDPLNRKGLAQQAVAHFEQGERLKSVDPGSASPFFERSAEAARALRDHNEALTETESAIVAVALFNEACILARTGEADLAADALGEAIASGFDDLDLLKNDEDLAAIRDRGEYREAVAALEQARNEQEERDRRRSVAMARDALEGFEPFPFDFRLPDTEGSTFALEDYRGKVAIVNFWGTWCTFCRQELPTLVALQERYGDEGLAVLGLNYEKVLKDEVVPRIRAFLAENEQMNYPCLVGDEATIRQLPDFSGFPTTLFLDREGKVRMMLAGYQEPEILEGLALALLEEGQTESEEAE